MQQGRREGIRKIKRGGFLRFIAENLRRTQEWLEPGCGGTCSAYHAFLSHLQRFVQWFLCVRNELLSRAGACSEIKRIYCPRILSFCLPRDGSFPHHFKGWKNLLLQLFRRRFPRKRENRGSVGVQKRARSDLLRALFRVSSFERFYTRLKSDDINKCKRLF